jgi:hypothetical protein
MKGMMQKRIALLFVAVLLFVALVPALYPLEDEGLLKDTSAHRVYSQLFAAYIIECDFGCHIGWTRNTSAFNSVWRLPNVVHSSTVTRAPPA